MQDQINQYFEDNADAVEVHIALGYLCSTAEEAQKKIKGVPGAQVVTITKEQAEDAANGQPGKEEPEHPMLVQFKKLTGDKLTAALANQEEIVLKKRASLKAEADQEKAAKALAFHEDMLAKFQAVFAEKQKPVDE